MDFLLGGKKKTKIAKTGQVATPSVNTTPQENVKVQQQTQENPADLPNGATNPTQNANEPQFVDANKPEITEGGPAAVRATNPADSNSSQMGAKKSVSEAIHKLHSDIKESSERMTGLVTEFKDMDTKVADLGHRVESLEEARKQSDEKLLEIDEQMTKFLSLYELINNQYNPFVDKDSMPEKINRIEINTDGNSNGNILGGESSLDPKELSALADKKIEIKDDLSDLESALVELDTLNIEQAAGDAVPLTHLKNNTNSLVIILSWLEYLIKRAGMEETRNTLRYYTEVLRWITPEVYFELDKYLKGMKDKKVETDEQINVKDHIVSLYFISKLNEKKLDEKLTSAVLRIIKQ